jgi:2-phospho-L-lactate guanylyltransferase
VKVVAVVPVKAFAAAKTRLSPLLAAERRADIAARLLDHVLDAILSSDAVDLCVVVSPDSAVLATAAALGAVPLRQASTGLNPGLEEGRAWAVRQGAGTLLVVLGDLPLLTPADVAGLVAQATGAPGVVLAPDRHGTGSNALLLTPPTAIPFHFGVDSAPAHIAAAAERGLPLRQYITSGTAFDVDTPADLQTWLATGVPAPLGGIG